jgi:hypothetical protein
VLPGFGECLPPMPEPKQDVEASPAIPERLADEQVS